jgi:hypothetical protein
MEQRLDATYIKRDLVDRAAATAFVAAGLGVGIFLAAWGVSLVWRYTPPEIAVRVANPEVRIDQSTPLVVKQDGAIRCGGTGPAQDRARPAHSKS